MKLTVVGCSGSVSGPRSPASCYLVQAPDQQTTFSLVLDLGPGALGALHNYLEPADIGAVGLSHLHPDHCLDLCGLYVAAAYSPGAPFARIPVYGPSGTGPRLTRAYEAPPPTAGGVTAEGAHLEERFAFIDWAPEQIVGPFRVQTTEVRHPTPAYAIRITETASGATLVYSGDTGPNQALVDLASQADLLLIEASFRDRPDNPPDLHLSGRQAAQIASEAQVKNLVLTHIPPWHSPDDAVAEARPHFSGPLVAAASAAQWSIEVADVRPLI